MANPEGYDPADFRVVAQTEVDLVEQVIRHRALYVAHLQKLRDYYEENGMIDKLRWAEWELADVSRIKPYRYLLSAEVPETDYRPTESIPEADALLAQAKTLMKEGGHGVPALYNEQKMKEALATLKQLLAEYPSSDKVAEAAYWCGLIHKEYFPGDELIAVRWFERAVEWDPDIQLPARFEAAVVYDLRLGERDKALTLYRAAIEHERFNRSGTLYAADRIEELTDEKESYLAPQSNDQADLPIEPTGEPAESASQ